MIHLLVGPTYWGDMSAEQVKKWEPRIFPCGMCSNTEAQVYHNLMGIHRHWSATEILPLLPVCQAAAAAGLPQPEACAGPPPVLTYPKTVEDCEAFLDNIANFRGHKP